MRLTFGLSMALTHGLGTLRGFISGVDQFPDPLGLGPSLSMGLMAFAEFFCAMAVALGLATRLACLPLMTGLGVAFFLFHSGDPFSRKELAFLYLAAFTTLALTGPGHWAIDTWLRRLKGKKDS
ncbi:MAG TPA: DoxX family protein [Acidobacteriota bacterium]|nr:DoxX family protein [Acidobacteriota bacterium]